MSPEMLICLVRKKNTIEVWFPMEFYIQVQGKKKSLPLLRGTNKLFGYNRPLELFAELM